MRRVGPVSFESEGSKIRSAWLRWKGLRPAVPPGFRFDRAHGHDAPFPAPRKEHGVVALAWSAIGAAKVAAFVPALLAQAGGQALFVACTAAFATQQAADPRRLLGLAFVGVLVKCAGQTGAAAIQAGWVAEVGRKVRASLLAGLRVGKSLRRPGLHDHGSLHAEVPAELAARVEDVERGVGEGLLPSVRAAAELAPLLALVAWTVPRFALGALAVILPFAWSLARFRKRTALAIEQQTIERQRLLRAFDDAVRHDELWRVHGASHRVRALVDAAGAAHGRLGAGLSARTELASGQNEALGVLFVWACVALAPDMASAPGLLLRFLAAFFLTYKPLRQLIAARTALSRGRAALSDLSLDLHGAAPADSARQWAAAPLRVEGLVLAHGCGAPIDLRAEPGSLWLVTGASGSGKTTLIRTLLGLQPPIAGAVCFANAALTRAGVGPAERPFSWMPQGCAIVGSCVEDALLLSGEAAEALDLLRGVAGDAHTLSGGEAQRVAFVRALSSPLPVVLLDEPTAHLDATTAERLVEHVQKERARGRTFVVVTHEPERFRRLPAVRELVLQEPPSFATGEAAE